MSNQKTLCNEQPVVDCFPLTAHFSVFYSLCKCCRSLAWALKNYLEMQMTHPMALTFNSYIQGRFIAHGVRSLHRE